MKRRLAFGGFVMTVLLAALPVMAKGQAIPKRLIQFGWDMQGPADLAQNIGKMQAMPFDGITIRTNYSYTFYMKDLKAKDVEAEIETLKRINWGKFTDNFFYFVAGANVDWFDDSLWAENGYILRNIGWCAKAAKAAGCAGLLFDPEFVYWGMPPGPWKYEVQPRAREHTFAEFEAMARKRGAQFMGRIEKEFPNPVIMTLFWGSMSEFLKAGREYDPNNREAILKQNYYGLLPAFLIGMLEAASPGTVIVDGNEGSYYYNSPIHYFESYHDIHQASQELVPQELRSKYRAQVQCGQAIYADYLCSTQDSHNTSTYLTPEERAKWMEHNVYWALKSSDRYVWFYNEHMNWLIGRNIPKELTPAIESARRKIAEGKPLGFDIAEITARGWQAVVAAENGAIKPKRAEIPRLTPGESPPKIDGILDDPAWAKAALLGPFVNYAVARRKSIEGKTEARMTYDDKRLYIAFVCKDPDMKALSTGKFTDEEICWTGDRVEFAIAAVPDKKAYYHLMVNCDNGRWGSLTEAKPEIYGKDASWTGEYQSAVRKGEDGWSAEIAIPWSSLGMTAPNPGTELKGNLMRRTHRWSDGVQEFSSWSESRRARYVEAENFGTWVLE